MDFNSFDEFLNEEINRIGNSSFTIVNALKENKIDKEIAFSVLSGLRDSAVAIFNKKSELYDSNNLDYSNIEESKRKFLEDLDSAVYSITNQQIVMDSETEKIINSLLS